MTGDDRHELERATDELRRASPTQFARFLAALATHAQKELEMILSCGVAEDIYEKKGRAAHARELVLRLDRAEDTVNKLKDVKR